MKIHREMGLFLESDEELMRLLAGMSKDLNEIQYQCKVKFFYYFLNLYISMRNLLYIIYI